MAAKVRDDETGVLRPGFFAVREVRAGLVSVGDGENVGE